MNILTLSVGALIILYGIYTLVVRVKTPHKLSKLAAMQEKLGAAGGSILHIVAYTAVPVIVGAIVIIAGMNGVSLADFFNAR